MATIIWLRAESKADEARSVLTPAQCGELVKNGMEVIVENSEQRIFRGHEYAENGCFMVEADNWRDAPADAWILGLKELPDDDSVLRHRHIYFAHAYKNQPGWEKLLGRFAEGGGQLYDLEYLLDENGRRVAAFGYWAGFVGCALAVKIWAGSRLGYEPVITALEPYVDRTALLEDVEVSLDRALATGNVLPSVIILGALGRVGKGASDLADRFDLDITSWDLEETARGGPFDEILERDIFINCVLVNKKIPPFISSDGVQHERRKLSVIGDVSCDPGPFNPIPLYNECTTFARPVQTLVNNEAPLHLCAIDHLPSLLPAESSEDFGEQLLPHLLNVADPNDRTWSGAFKLFNEKCASLF